MRSHWPRRAQQTAFPRVPEAIDHSIGADGMRTSTILLLTALFIAPAAVRSQAVWEPVRTGFERLRPHTIIAAPDGMIYLASESGVHISSDNGASWTRAILGTRWSTVEQLLRTSRGVLVVRQHDDILRSVDNGLRWSIIESKEPPKFGGLNWGDIFELDSALFASRNGDYVRSTDDGATWQKFFDADSLPNDERRWWSCVPGLDGSIYFVRSDSLVARVRPGIDGHEIVESPPPYVYDSWSRFHRARSGAVYANRSNNVPMGDRSYRVVSHLMRSSDDGASWVVIDTVGSSCFAEKEPGIIYLAQGARGVSRYDEMTGLIERVDTNATAWLAFAPDGVSLAARSYVGLVRSGDGHDWVPIEPNTSVGHVSLIQPAGDGSILTVFDWMLLRSIDDGRTWSVLNDSLDNISAIHVAPSGVILVGTGWSGKGAVHVSTDDGRSWQMLSDRLPGTVESFLVTRRGILYAGLAESGVFGRLDGSLWRSVDGGWSWEPTSLTGPLSALVEARDGSVLASTFETSDMIGAEVCLIFRSIDDGRTWDTVLGKRDVWSMPNYCGIDLVVDREGRIFTSGGPQVHRSTDNGRTWSRFAVFDPNDGERWFHTRALTVDSLGNLYTHRSWGGIFRSSDAGETWAQWDLGIDDNSVTSIATATNGTVFAGSYYLGLFRLEQAARNEGLAPTEGSGTAQLMDIHPNPVTDGATVEIVVAEESEISVGVSDLLGRDLGTIVRGWRRPGRYQLRIDTEGLADGTYYCTLVSNGARVQKRFVVMKRN
jgi:photosystem II stability/assembly factor-like uncharacterized protein